MSHDVALGLAQILLALVVVTLSLPALTFADEPIRQVFNRRVRRWPILVLMGVSLVLAVGLMILSGSTRQNLEPTAKMVVAIIFIVFATVWVSTVGSDVRQRLLNDVANRMSRTFRRGTTFHESDVDDLVSLGEALRAGEKSAVIDAIGRVCRDVQEHPRYSGSELHPVVEGLQRVITSDLPASDENYRKALAVIDACWTRLVRKNLTRENDAGVLQETACVVGETAIKDKSDTVALRTMMVIPNLTDLPYRIGAAALRCGRYRLAIIAFGRLESTAAETGSLSRQLLALSASFCLAGGSAATHAREMGRRLGYDVVTVRDAAREAARQFEVTGDFGAADAIRAAWLT